MARHSKIAFLYKKTLQTPVFAWIEATFHSDVSRRSIRFGLKHELNQWVSSSFADPKNFGNISHFTDAIRKLPSAIRRQGLFFPERGETVDIAGQYAGKRPEEHDHHRLHVDELSKDDQLRSAYRSKTMNASPAAGGQPGARNGVRQETGKE